MFFAKSLLQAFIGVSLALCISGRILMNLGCFNDSCRRDLSGLFKEDVRGNTPEKCAKLCKAKGFALAGTQYGKFCFCGNKFGKYGKTHPRNCNFPCPGNPKKICGGRFTNSLSLLSELPGIDLGCLKQRRKVGLDGINNGHFIMSVPRMTVRKCALDCAKRGYRFAGLTWSAYCQCGNNVTFKYGFSTGKLNCTFRCQGGERKCGNWPSTIRLVMSGFTTDQLKEYNQFKKKNYKGCYRDAGKRDLTKYLFRNAYNNIKLCVDGCKLKGYKFAGVQAGYQCFCGDEFGLYEKRPERECRYKCGGNRFEKCGGSWRNSIYATGVVKKEPNYGKAYLGCFKDTGRRDLDGATSYTTKLTIQMCIAECKNKGFRFAGMQVGLYCFCGNRFGRYGKVNHRWCNSSCRGNHRQKCGGSWKNSIYSTGVSAQGARDYLANIQKKYVGCFQTSSQLDLNGMKRVYNRYNYIKYCIDICRKKNFAYAGIAAQYCSCGDVYNKYFEYPDNYCRYKCPGHFYQKCGGSAARNSIYRTGIKEKDGKRLFRARLKRKFYKGCYRGHLKHFVANLTSPYFYATIKRCQKLCRERNFLYSGLYHNGYQCRCGNTYQNLRKGTRFNCQNRSNGDFYEKNGHGAHSAIYATGLNRIQQRNNEIDLKRKYVGCYYQAGRYMFINEQFNLTSNQYDALHPRKCINYCADRGYPLASLTHGYMCNCGRKVPTGYYKRWAYKTREAYCRTRCRGDPSSFCGGSWRGAVYKTGISPNILPKYHAYLEKRYIGCYQSNPSRPDLDGQRLNQAGIDLNNQYPNTPLNCLRQCEKLGFLYAGMSLGSRCYCGNKFGKYGKRQRWYCTSKCPGGLFMCGGGWRNSVYRTEVTEDDQDDRAAFMKKHYIGCLQNGPIWDLNGAKFYNTQLNGEKCIRFCGKQGYRYARTYVNQCWCGDSYGKYKKEMVSERLCNYKCYGNQSQSCGGSGYRHTLYRTPVLTKAKYIDDLVDIELPKTVPKKKNGYIGCYYNLSLKDTLGYRFAHGRMTPEMCQQSCKTRGFIYAALYHTTCLCGNTYGNWAKTLDSSCTLYCRGNKNKYCGGTNLSSVYSTGLDPAQVKAALANRKAAYVGCYRDAGRRDLPHKYYSSSTLHIDQCRFYCKKHNYNYAGMQVGLQCFCGDDYGLYGKRPDRECNTTCRGHQGQICGSGWRNSIYKTGLNKPKPKLPDGYLGCYQDSGNRMLKGFHFWTSKMTNELCIKACKERSFVFAATQARTHCFCGQKLWRKIKRSERECNYTCPGRSLFKKFKCGGSWRNSVWRTGLSTKAYEAKQALYKKLYVGCYQRSNTFPGLVGTKDIYNMIKGWNHAMYIGFCHRTCRQKGFTYFSLNRGYSCLCGNIKTSSYHRNVMFRYCNVRCRGNKHQFCGGNSYTSVYRTGITGKNFQDRFIAKLKKKYYKGCYKDGGRRDLPSYSYYWNRYDHVTSITYCIRHCRVRNYKYVGLQLRACYCGNSYGRYGKRPEHECTVTCEGNRNQSCGRGYHNSVYSTGLTEARRQLGERKVREKYLGCYADNGHYFINGVSRTFNYMHTRACFKFCQQGFYPYFSLRSGTQCRCGTTNVNDPYFKRLHRRLPDSHCNYRCNGDTARKCGGASHWRPAVYNTGLGRDVFAQYAAFLQTRYKGCFGYHSQKRFFSTKSFIYHVPRVVDIDFCNTYCRKNGYRYSAFYTTYQCYCMNTYNPRLDKRPDHRCNHACYANAMMKCGGSGVLAIHETGATEDDVSKYVQAIKRSYVGCFKQHSNIWYRAMFGSTNRMLRMNPGKCLKYCAVNGYGYAGLYKDFCLCGDSYQKWSTKQPEFRCNQPCKYDIRFKCGSHAYFNVYRTSRNMGKKIPTIKEVKYTELPEDKTANIEGKKAFGCFRIKNHFRYKKRLIKNDFRMTPGKCISYCKNANFKFAGVEDYRCYCGNRGEEPWGQIHYRQCLRKCRGSNESYCGQVNYYQMVYQV